MSVWDTIYEKSVKTSIGEIEKTKGVLLGFNTNIDAIKHVSIDVLKKLSYGSQLPNKDMKAERTIYTRTDLLFGLLHCMEQGIGEEWQILDPSTYDWLNNNFIPDSVAVGGQSGIMASVASKLGIKEVILNAPVVPKMLANLLGKDILIPRTVNGQLKLFFPHELATESNELIHWIFEFKKGFSVDIQGKRFVVPESRRFIATYDPINSEVTIDPGFVEAGKQFALKMKGAVLGGHHLLKPNKTSEYYLKKAIAVKDIVKMWKAENPDFLIKYELGIFSSKVIVDVILKFVLSNVDIIGANELELYQLVGIDKIQRNITPEERVNLILKSLIRLKDLARPSIGIHFHSMALDMFYLTNPDTIKSADDLEKIEHSIALAALLTSVTAQTGETPKKETLYKYANQNSFYFTETTKKMCDALTDSIRNYNGKKEEILNLGYTSFDSGILFVVPIKYVPNPVKSVGLGDTCSITQFLSYPQ